MGTESVRDPSLKVQIAIFSVMGLVTLFFLVVCAGMAFLIQALFQLTTGWVLYLRRILPELTVSVSGTLWFLICLGLFTAGLHLVCRRVYCQKKGNTVEADGTIWRLRWSLSVVTLVLVLVSSGISLIGVSHQLWWMASGKDKMLYRGGMTAMRRSSSKHNLRQIGLALQQYHDEHTRFPSGGIFGQTGQPQHGWVAQLLPYLEHEELYRQIEFSQPWTAEVNRKPYETQLPVVQSPGMIPDYIEQEISHVDDTGYQPAHYSANSHVLGINHSLKIHDIKDGAANTILAGEVKEGIRAWGDPLNFRDPAQGINRGPDGFGSHFEQDQKTGAHILFCDGSVRFVSDEIDSDLLKRLSLPADGETVLEGW
ncbi:hypothetical protein Pan153_01290 [Gimesia panareensis]|uniref:DUF1559 domain-containing protein n=1 Tax=Gimesia panareensis TaxID=2527978 RepID=A0A518FGQ4_9PLAN|nr:DUF1559 domain-containing protein [Gimesia panareensis]QDV15515.1 hypothetical protein Pan153_01290 [Gimesia panareensis]